MKTDRFLQGLDWLTSKEVEEEEGGRNNTCTRAMEGDCRSWGGRNTTKACTRDGDGRSRGRGGELQEPSPGEGESRHLLCQGRILFKEK